MQNNNMDTLVLDIFGRRMIAERTTGSWRLYLPGDEGKRRPFTDVMIPRDVETPQELVQFLDDQLHELATARHGSVKIIDSGQA